MSKKGTEPEMSSDSSKPLKKSTFREYSEALLVAFILALIIRTFIIQAFKIPSGSMEDTLLIGDHLLVNKFIYGTKIPFTDDRILPIRDPQRGDVIVFEYPEDTRDPNLSMWQKKDFIKRIVGVPGDTVEVRNKEVILNGQPFHIPQEVHKDSHFYARRDMMAPLTVPPGQFFVMGDNRDNSQDSRFWGFVPMENIKGLAFIKYWSWDGEKHWPRFSRIGGLIK